MVLEKRINFFEDKILSGKEIQIQIKCSFLIVILSLTSYLLMKILFN